MEEDESIQTVINVESDRSYEAYHLYNPYHGIVKRNSVRVCQYSSKNGLKALNLKDEDELINVLLTEGDMDIIIGTNWLCASLFNHSRFRNEPHRHSCEKG